MTKHNARKAFTLYAFLLCVSQMANAQERNYVFIDSTDTGADIVRKAAQVVPSPRQLRWQQLELTAFFHFGINTFTNREWGTGKEDPQLFNPADLDARQWIAAVKKAGIRQVILTAKHHDGFCLWPTKTTRHSVASSPWKNGNGDVVREVAEASREAGIGFGVYLSPWDMNSPVYGSDAYNDLFVAQLTELLTQYGRIDEVWFDGANGEGPNGKKQEYDFNRWYALIRKLQPTATIAIMGPDVRWVGTESGHGRETEWSVVPANNLDPAAIAGNSQQEIDRKPMGDMQQQDLGSREKIKKAKALVWYPAETDVSIRPGWFYHAAEDSKVKTNQELVNIYFNSVGRNGVLLLNIPPDTRGRIHEADEKALWEWKASLDRIFARNLAALATKKPTNSKALFDDNDESHLALNKGLPAQLELGWDSPQTLNVLALQENIRKGQRVEAFRLEYWNGSSWQTAATGTTIGYKRLLRFERITTSRIRLVITEARDTPHLASFGLYHDAQQH